MSTVAVKGTLTAAGAIDLSAKFSTAEPLRAVLLWTTGATATGSARGVFQPAFGWATNDGGSIQQAYQSLFSVDAANPTVAGASMNTTAALRALSTTATVAYAITVSAFTSTGFTTTFGTSPPAGTVIHYLALGGSHITRARSFTGTTPAATGTANHTVVTGGGQPDLVLLGGNRGSAGDSGVAMGLSAFLKATTARGIAFGETTAVATSASFANQRAAVVVSTNGATAQPLATVSAVASWPTDGFQLNYSAVPAFGTTFVGLALYGTFTATLGAVTAKTATPLTQDLSHTDDPSAFLSWGWNQAANAGGVSSGTGFLAFHVGAYDGTNQGAAAATTQDATTGAVTGRAHSVTAAVSHYAAASTLTLQDESVASKNGNAIRLTQNATDTVARESNYLILGPAPPTTVAVGADLATPWTVRAAHGADLTTPWSVKRAAGADLVAPWYVNRAAGSDLVTPWTVRKPVGADQALPWTVRVLHGRDLATPWTVKAAHGRDLVLLWSVGRPSLTDLVDAFSGPSFDPAKWGGTAAIVAGRAEFDANESLFTPALAYDARGATVVANGVDVSGLTGDFYLRVLNGSSSTEYAQAYVHGDGTLEFDEAVGDVATAPGSPPVIDRSSPFDLRIEHLVGTDQWRWSYRQPANSASWTVARTASVITALPDNARVVMRETTASTGKTYVDGINTAQTTFTVGHDVALPWTMRRAAGRDLQSRWSITGRVGADLVLQWEMTRFVRVFSSQPLTSRDVFVAGVLTAVGRDLQAQWVVRRAAGQDLATPWHVNRAAGRDLVTPWWVRRAAGRDVTTPWTIRIPHGRDLDLAWTNRRLVANDLVVPWRVSRAAGRDLILQWGVTGAIGRDLVTPWQVRYAAGHDLALPWAVRGLAGRDTALGWIVRVAAGRDVTLPWQVRRAASRELATPWTVRGTTGRDLQAAWYVRGLAGANLETPWDILGAFVAVGRDLGLAWFVRRPSGRDLATPWTVRRTAAADLQAAWTILASVGAETDLPWTLRGLAGADLDQPWTVGGLAGQDLEAPWTVLWRIGREITVPWNVTGGVGRDLTVRWGVGGAIGRDLTVSWEISNHVGHIYPPAPAPRPRHARHGRPRREGIGQ